MTKSAQPSNDNADICDSTFENILIPVNSGVTSDSIVELALKMAANYGATVHALYIVEMRSTPDQWDLVVERNEHEGEQAVEHVEERARSIDVEVIKRFRYGTLYEAIPAYVSDYGIDLVTMRVSAQSRLAKLIRPKSIVQKTLHRIDVPVLLLRTKDKLFAEHRGRENNEHC